MNEYLKIKKNLKRKQFPLPYPNFSIHSSADKVLFSVLCQTYFFLTAVTPDFNEWLTYLVRFYFFFDNVVFLEGTCLIIFLIPDTDVVTKKIYPKYMLLLLSNLPMFE